MYQQSRQEDIFVFREERHNAVTNVLRVLLRSDFDDDNNYEDNYNYSFES